VYQVKSREDGRRYAVKCALELYRNSADRRWKLREAEKHEMLPPHANLVRFYMAWEEKQRLYIQTELCETSLDKIAENNHEIPESDVWKYFIDILLVSILYHLLKVP
jgi:membrane-associated tyrosine- and threonine-specific cdc2-inhibitory kinase